MLPLLVLFDIDGTLVDTAGAGRRAIERAFVETWRIDPTDARTDGVRYAGMTDPGIFRSLAVAFGIPPAEYAAGQERLRDAYFGALGEEMRRPDSQRRVLPGVAELLEHLDTVRDIHLGLLTGNLERGARIKLEPFGLLRHFESGGFGSDHEDRGQIARIAHLRLSKRLDHPFPASRVAVVGDTEHDISCARTNGFRSIAVATGTISHDSLRQCGPDALFSDLLDRSAVCEALGAESR